MHCLHIFKSFLVLSFLFDLNSVRSLRNNNEYVNPSTKTQKALPTTASQAYDLNAAKQDEDKRDDDSDAAISTRNYDYVLAGDLRELCKRTTPLRNKRSWIFLTKSRDVLHNLCSTFRNYHHRFHPKRRGMRHSGDLNIKSTPQTTTVNYLSYVDKDTEYKPFTQSDLSESRTRSGGDNERTSVEKLQKESSEEVSEKTTKSNYSDRSKMVDGGILLTVGLRDSFNISDGNRYFIFSKPVQPHLKVLGKPKTYQNHSDEKTDGFNTIREVHMFTKNRKGEWRAAEKHRVAQFGTDRIIVYSESLPNNNESTGVEPKNSNWMDESGGHGMFRQFEGEEFNRNFSSNVGDTSVSARNYSLYSPTVQKTQSKPLEKTVDEKPWPGVYKGPCPHSGSPSIRVNSGLPFRKRLPRFEARYSRERSSSDRATDLHLPSELLPIHPGGGSKFDDWEREKLEKNKMSQKKDKDEDLDYDARGFTSSAPRHLGILNSLNPGSLIRSMKPLNLLDSINYNMNSVRLQLKRTTQTLLSEERINFIESKISDTVAMVKMKLSEFCILENTCSRAHSCQFPLDVSVNLVLDSDSMEVLCIR